MTDKKKSKEQNQPVEKKPGEEMLNKFHWKQAGKTSLVWVVILVSAIFLSNLLHHTNFVIQLLH